MYPRLRRSYSSHPSTRTAYPTGHRNISVLEEPTIDRNVKIDDVCPPTCTGTHFRVSPIEHPRPIHACMNGRYIRAPQSIGVAHFFHTSNALLPPKTVTTVAPTGTRNDKNGDNSRSFRKKSSDQPLHPKLNTIGRIYSQLAYIFLV